MTAEPQSLTVRVPLTIRRRGGRKQIVGPDGTGAAAPPPRRVDAALVKALARAFRWRRRIEEGRFATIDDLAAAERINASYVSRILRLSLLAPDVVEAVLDGRQPADLELTSLMGPIPGDWEAQRLLLRGSGP